MTSFLRYALLTHSTFLSFTQVSCRGSTLSTTRTMALHQRGSDAYTGRFVSDGPTERSNANVSVCRLSVPCRLICVHDAHLRAYPLAFETHQLLLRLPRMHLPMQLSISLPTIPALMLVQMLRAMS